MAADFKHQYLRKSTFVNPVSAVVLTSFVFLLILLGIGNTGKVVSQCTSAKWSVPYEQRHILGLTGAAACGVHALVLLYTLGFSGGRKRRPVMAAAAYCTLAAFMLILDAHNLLYRPCDIELGLHVLAFTAGVVVSSVIYTTLDLHCGEQVAVQVMDDRVMYAPVLIAAFLYTVPRAILQASDGHPASLPLAAVLSFVIIFSFVYYALKGSMRVERHLPPHWTVMLSGTCVLLAWVIVDIVHLCIAAGVPGVQPVHALFVLQLHLVMEVVQMTVAVSQAVMSYEESSRFKAERDAVQAELTSRIKSEQQAHEAEDARQKFLRDVFHEIRVPFNSLDMGLGMILDDLATAPTTSPRRSAPGFFLPEDAKVILEIMAKAASSRKVIMNDTLDWSKLQSGAFQVSLGVKNFAELLSTTVMGLAAFANHRDNRVKLEYGVDPRIPPLLLADKVRLQQVIANFLSNAIKFAPHDGTGLVSLHVLPVLDELQSPHGSDALDAQPAFSPGGVWWKAANRVSTDSTAANAETEGHNDGVLVFGSSIAVSGIRSLLPTVTALHVSPECEGRLQAEGLRLRRQGETCTLAIVVRDNGDGIASGDVSQLFRAFRQLGAGMQYKGKGTGLGLAICHEMVSLHGGRVGVRSSGEKGKGAEFIIVLKLPVLDDTRSNSPVQSPQHVLNLETTLGHYVGAQGLMSSTHRRQSGTARQASPLPHPVAGSALLSSAHNASTGDAGRPLAKGSSSVNHSYISSLTVLEGMEQGLPGEVEDAARQVTGRKSVPGRTVVRILVVDDVLENRRMLAKALHRRLASLFYTGDAGQLPDITIHEAEDGHIAVEKVTGQAAPGYLPSAPLPHDGVLRTYDVITMDMEMPTMPGFVATRQLREAGFEGLIIGCTGNALEEDQKLFLDSGADTVFIKPVDVGLVALKIAAFFSKAEEDGKDA